MKHRCVSFLRAMVNGAASPIELVRSLTSSDLRRAFPRYYRNRARVASAIGVVLAFSSTRVVFRRTAFALAGTLVARNGWRTRSRWGAGAGVPPGRVGVGSRAVHDPEHFSKAIGRYGPVFKTNHFDEPAVCLAGMQLARQVFRDNADSLEGLPLTFNQYVPGGLVRWKDGAEHDEYRRVFQHIFSHTLVRTHQRVFDQSVDRFLEKLHAVGSFEGARPDVHLHVMIFEAWTQLFYGIAPGDDHYPELVGLYDSIDVSKLPKPDRMRPALDRLESILSTIGAPDGNSALDAVRARTTPALQPAMIRNLIFMLDMTRRDMAGLLLWSLHHVATNPDVLDELAREADVANPDFATRSLCNRMVSETLRLEQSEHLFRRAKYSFDIGRYRVPEGWLVRVCTQESHRDPTLFPNPDRYDPGRFSVAGSLIAFAPFGVDKHSCIGETLTRRFAGTFLHRLAVSYRVEVVDDGPRELSSFQHWAPNDRFRLRLVAR